MFCGRTKSVMWLFVGALAMALVAQQAQAEIEFGIPEPMQAPFNEGGGYAYPWLTGDDLTMYFGSTAPGSAGGSDISYSTRSSIGATWSTPINLGETINTELSETFPSMTADRLELYFQRTSDPFTHADGEIYVSKRAAVTDPWGLPETLELNSDVRDASPHISSDGLTLYFDSTRPAPDVDYEFNTWVASRSSRSEPFGEPERFFAGLGFVTDDGLTHLFSTGPVGAGSLAVPNYGTDDIYMRTRESITAEFGPVTHLGAPVNSSGLDCCVALGISDSTLYLTSSRPGAPTDGLLGFVNMWQAPIAEAVSVDVKPGSEPTPINLNSKGVLPVAILSTEEFDARQVDVETLLFGDPLLIADGKSPVSALRGKFEDVDDDGLDDLTLKFSMRELLNNEVLGIDTVEGYLAGQTVEGVQFAGRDLVQIVGKGPTIPEPASLLLMLTGLTALALNSKKSFTR
ncbi:MAG: PEP-CTERM sorting domain-containing protein [Bythopirellula sp.]